MKKQNGYKVLYGTGCFGVIRCGSCGYEWAYSLYEGYCPWCGASI